MKADFTRFQRKYFRSDLLPGVATCISTFLCSLVLSKSLYISWAISLFVAILFGIIRVKADAKRNFAIHGAAPEVIDLLISGIQSGLSLNETLVSLADRGPDVLKNHFIHFKALIYSSGDFEESISTIKSEIAHPTMDQILESLAMAKVLGSAELLNILRLLGSFIREDLEVRREIQVKHGWIKNSAHLSASAPWILLLLLSTQPSTAAAYSTQSGAFVLGFGLIATAIAYLWMNRLSRMPEPERIFTKQNAPNLI